MDGEPPQEEDFSQIPLVERSQHKVSGDGCHSIPAFVASVFDCGRLSEVLRRYVPRIGKPGYQHITTSLRNQQRLHPIPTLSSDPTYQTGHCCAYCSTELDFRRAANGG